MKQRNTNLPLEEEKTHVTPVRKRGEWENWTWMPPTGSPKNLQVGTHTEIDPDESEEQETRWTEELSNVQGSL